MTHCGHISDFGLLWIDNDARNLAAILKPDVLPIFAAIGGSINAVTPIGGIAIVRFAGADPNRIGIRWRNGDSANGERRLLVENRIEGYTVVIRFENAAVSEADVENKWIARIDCDVRNTAAHHRRADCARLEVFEKHIGKLWRCRPRR